MDALICANLATLHNLQTPFPYTHGKRLMSLFAPQSFSAFRLRLRRETSLVMNDSMLYALHLSQCAITSLDAPNLLHLTLSSMTPSTSFLPLNLRSLHLINVPMTDGFLEAALRLPRLERLVILQCTMPTRTRHILFTFLSHFLSKMNACNIENGMNQQKRFLFLISGFTNTTETAAFRSFYTNVYLKAYSSSEHEMMRLKMEIGKRAEEVMRRLGQWYWQDFVA